MAAQASSALTACSSTSAIWGAAVLKNVPQQAKHAARRVEVSASWRQENEAKPSSMNVAVAACGALAAVSLALAAPSLAAKENVRLPPLSQDPYRCERAYVGNTIGQANGVADKLLDLRKCNYAGEKEQLKGKTLSAALLADAVFDGADMTEVVMSKAYAVGASFKGVDFTSSVLDRVVFDGSDLTGANFYNAVLSGSTFDDAILDDADFEDALIGYVDVQKICRNKSLSEIARLQLGCR